MHLLFWFALLALLALNVFLVVTVGLLSCWSPLVPSWLGYALAPALCLCVGQLVRVAIDPPSAWPRRI